MGDLYDWADVCVDDSAQEEEEVDQEDSLGYLRNLSVYYPLISLRYFELSTAFPVTKLRGQRDKTLKVSLHCVAMVPDDSVLGYGSYAQRRGDDCSH